jgi:hypothetical protein
MDARWLVGFVFLPGIGFASEAYEDISSAVKLQSGRPITLVVPMGQSRSYSSVILKTEGGQGQRGELGVQKQDGQPGGSIRIDVDGQLTLDGSQKTGLEASSIGANSIDGSNAFNFSAGPSGSGEVVYRQLGSVLRSGSDDQQGFAISLSSVAGNWEGVRDLDIRSVDRPWAELRGAESGNVTVTFAEGATFQSDTAGIQGASFGGAVAPAWGVYGESYENILLYLQDSELSCSPSCASDLAAQPVRNAGDVSFSITGATIETVGVAVSALSQGGGMGDYTGSDQNRPGGNAGVASIRLERSRVRTSGRAAHGLVVQSLGGSVSAGSGASIILEGLDGAPGGNGGNATAFVSKDSTVVTGGDLAFGLFLQSSGAGGGDGGGGLFAGGDGGAAGSGKRADALLMGQITTLGDGAYGVYMGGLGGGRIEASSDETQGLGTVDDGGGDGGKSLNIFPLISVAKGGAGGAGGSGPAVDIKQFGAVQTQGDYATGVFGNSVGGNGGDGGVSASAALGIPIPINQKGDTISPAFSLALGGSGGPGGDGGDIEFSSDYSRSLPARNLNLSPQVSTAGINSPAVRLISTGGGGGAGGNAFSLAGSLPADVNLTFSTSKGGSGGGGGAGGDITANNTGLLTTEGLQSAGLLAASTGGGGGTGGFTLSAYLDLTGKANSKGAVGASTSIGGTGGGGGGGGSVTITNAKTGRISTQVDNSPTIYASSVGGGGGRGGDSIGLGLVLQSDAIAASAAVGVGGRGGDGGHGGEVLVTNAGTLSAGESGLATYSYGIFAQSVGGGGGEGGVASSVTLDLYKTFLGFTNLQEDAKKRGSVVLGNNTDQGGNKGGVQVPKSLRANLAVGGSGGAGGHGASVRVSNTGNVGTFGANSAAIFAQSVGGGGGIGKGTFSKQTLNQAWTGQLQFGGDGGAAGDGGDVRVENAGLLKTQRDGSPGVFAQSVGGGGGKGGSDNIEGINPKETLSTIAKYTGYVEKASSIKKWKDARDKKKAEAAAAEENPFAGVADLFDEDQIPKPKPTKLSASLNMSVGGDGGAAGNGGIVTVESTALIETRGDVSPGVFAQSIGGGGGQGGTGLVAGKTASIGGKDAINGIRDITQAADDVSKANSVKSLVENVTNSLGANIAVGGDGGAKGDGGEVSAIIRSDVLTRGKNSPGVFIQSIGGGGGQGGSAQDNSSGLLRFSFRFGGDGSQTGGHGAKVSVSLGGATPSRVVTEGNNSPGVRLQSIGGGGGTVNLMAANFYEYFNKDVRDANAVDPALVTDALVRALEGKDIVDATPESDQTGDKKSGGESTWDQLLAAGEKVANYAQKAYGAWKGDPMSLVQQIAKDAGVKKVPKSLVEIGYESPGNGASGGNGGDVTATLDDVTIVTQGTYSPGLSAWSIGGGGGLATKPDDSALLKLVYTGKAVNGTSGDGGAIDLTLSKGSIATQGDRSYGIQAQSIGGGGGWIGEADILAVSTDQTSAQDDQTSGNGGKVTLTSQGALDISTQGSHAHGIFAVSAGGGFGAVGVSDGLVVLNEDVSGGHAGDIDLTYRGNLSTGGDGSVGVLAVTSGKTDHLSQMSVTLNGATIQTASDMASAGVGLIGRQARYLITLDDKATILNADGFALATQVARDQGDKLAQWAKDTDYTWKEIGVRTGADFNTVKVTGGSTLSGNVTLSGATKLVIDGQSKWYPGQNSVIGSSGGVRTPQWLSPVKFASLTDGDWTYGSLPVELNQPGQVIVDQGATLNPGGPGQFVNSRVYIGAAGDSAAQLWLAGGATLAVDIGHNNGQVVHDQLKLNPGTSGQAAIVAGGAREGGGYNLKIRLLGLRGVVGKQFTVAQVNGSIMSPDRLLQPLAVSGQKYITDAVTGPSQTQRLRYSLDDVAFDRSEMSGFARSIARQFDRHLLANNFSLEDSMVAALAYYPGQEGAYENEMHELAENGSALDVLGRRLQGLFIQNFLHSCQAFVGQGLGLVEQDCTYARVTGTDVHLSASGASAAQDVSGSQIALGGQRRIGQDLFAGFLFGAGQSSSDSTDGEYRSSNQSLSIGAVIKKRFDEKYEVALSGTYSHGWTDSNRFINSRLTAPANLTGSTKDNEAGLRLRLAYYATTDSVYVKPYVDFDARYYRSDAWTESGNSPFAMSYPSMSFWTYTATPMLEVGTRINTKEGVWRAFASGGVALSNDNKKTMLADFVTTNGGAPIEMQWEATPTMGIVKVGAEYVGQDNSFFTLSYEGMFGDGVRQQSLMARVGVRF